jgi:hypothetical protein
MLEHVQKKPLLGIWDVRTAGVDSLVLAVQTRNIE